MGADLLYFKFEEKVSLKKIKPLFVISKGSSVSEKIAEFLF